MAENILERSKVYALNILQATMEANKVGIESENI